MSTWIVCGGRHYSNEARVFQILDAAVDRLALTRVVTGGATGADTLAAMWALLRTVDNATYPADWRDLTHPDCMKRRRADGRMYDANAGFRRNQEMLNKEQPVGVIAFRGGMGTLDMCKRAHAASIRVVPIDWEFSL